MPNASQRAGPNSADGASIASGKAVLPPRKEAQVDIRVLRTRHGRVTLKRDQVVTDTRDEEIRLLSLDPLVGLRLSQNTIHRYGDDGMELGLMRGPRLNFDPLAEPRAAVEGWISPTAWREKDPGVLVTTVYRDKPDDGDCVFVRQVEDGSDADRAMEQVEQIAQRLQADIESATRAAVKRMQDAIDRLRRQKLAGKDGA